MHDLHGPLPWPLGPHRTPTLRQAVWGCRSGRHAACRCWRQLRRTPWSAAGAGELNSAGSISRCPLCRTCSSARAAAAADAGHPAARPQQGAQLPSKRQQQLQLQRDQRVTSQAPTLVPTAHACRQGDVAVSPLDHPAGGCDGIMQASRRVGVQQGPATAPATLDAIYPPTWPQSHLPPAGRTDVLHTNEMSWVLRPKQSLFPVTRLPCTHTTGQAPAPPSPAQPTGPCSTSSARTPCGAHVGPKR